MTVMKLSIILILLLGSYSLPLSAQQPGKLPNNPTLIQYQYIEEPVVGCNGDVIDVSGTLMILIHMPPHGGAGNAIARANYSGITGVSESTGERYHLMGQDFIVVRVMSAGYMYMITGIRTLHLVGNGVGTDFRVTELQHIIINNEGIREVKVEQRTVKCQGTPTDVTGIDKNN